MSSLHKLYSTPVLLSVSGARRQRVSSNALEGEGKVFAFVLSDAAGRQQSRSLAPPREG